MSGDFVSSRRRRGQSLGPELCVLHSVTNGDAILIQIRCPSCRDMVQRSLWYLRAHRVLRCESCGLAVRDGDTVVAHVEEELRKRARKLH